MSIHLINYVSRIGGAQPKDRNQSIRGERRNKRERDVKDRSEKLRTMTAQCHIVLSEFQLSVHVSEWALFVHSGGSEVILGERLTDFFPKHTCYQLARLVHCLQGVSAFQWPIT